MPVFLSPFSHYTPSLKKTSPMFLAITRESIVGFGRNITEKVSNQKCPGCFLLRHSVVVVVSECVQSSCFAPLNNMSVIFSV